MRMIRVASRKSNLAMTQTKWVIDQLTRLDGRYTYEIVPTVTKGDQVLDVALSKVGGKGLFVNEIEQVLVTRQADFAVHSLKDVPAQLADGLTLAAMPPREDPRDALISRDGTRLQDLQQGALIGTSSLRRLAQLRALRPDLRIETLRGNIDTRLRKLQRGEFDAIVLAAAGLHRMGWQERITEYLDPQFCLPALGQGILGIECRVEDAELRTLLAELTDQHTELAAKAERRLLFELNGSCQVPIGGLTSVLPDGSLRLEGMVANPSGPPIIRAQAEGHDAEELGVEVSRRLRELGAEEILGSVASGSA